MLRLLAIFGGAILANEIFFKGNASNYPNIGGISEERTSRQYLKRYKVRDNETAIKQHITKSINAIIREYDGFKIGKSGVETRGKNYNDYDAIYYLCSSSNRDDIKALEAHYNDKYFDHSKNENFKRGSAGRMSDDSKLYYLYIVVR